MTADRSGINAVIDGVLSGVHADHRQQPDEQTEPRRNQRHGAISVDGVADGVAEGIAFQDDSNRQNRQNRASLHFMGAASKLFVLLSRKGLTPGC
jgi:hypothetical protein